jgi:hypothetical protein
MELTVCRDLIYVESWLYKLKTDICGAVMFIKQAVSSQKQTRTLRIRNPWSAEAKYFGHTSRKNINMKNTNYSYRKSSNATLCIALQHLHVLNDEHLTGNCNFTFTRH